MSQSLKPLNELQSRPDVIRSKHIYGMTYGIVVGLGFAGAAWGVDAYLLSHSHALYPWLKFMVSAILCALTGGLTGWLVARLDNGFLALLLWLVCAFAFAWLTNAVPFQIFPQLVGWLEPDIKDVLKYVYYESFQLRFWIALIWIAIFVTIAGILQLPLADSAVFSISIGGRVTPFLLCLVIMGISGAIIDDLNNLPLRTSVIAMDQTIQYVLDTQGQPVDPAESRRLHAASLRNVQDQIQASRRLLVGSFDEFFGEIHILIRFGDQWVDCSTIYAQPSFCKPASGN